MGDFRLSGLTDECVIVVDGEFQRARRDLNDYARFLSRCMRDYTNILTNISAEAISDGQLSDSLAEFCYESLPLASEIDDVRNKFDSKIRNFVSNVNSADNIS
ncbi:MAG: hypothetical protein FWD05_04505 [Oscillospiraceae bacterium]|nr:hypothetical protein [Oscillospiraceae bacterium]